MKRNVVLMLVAVNAALLVTLGLRMAVHESPAHAQAARRGEYLLIPGNATGASVGIVYIIDQTSGELGAIAPDNNDVMQTQPSRINLSKLFDDATAGQMPAGRNPPRRR